MPYLLVRTNKGKKLGLGVLFGKLQQGVIENRQVMTIARLRAEAEEIYGQRLSEIVPTVDKVQGGFSTDDGASVRKVSLRMGGTQYENLLTLVIWNRHTMVYEPRWRMPRGTTRRSPRTSET